MRGHRQGTVTKCRDRWRVRITLDDGTRKSLGTYATPEEADLVLGGALAELADNDMMSGRTTVAAYGRRVLDRREDSIRGIAGERSTFECHVVSSSLGSLPISEVTRRDGDLWIEELSRRPSQRDGAPLDRGSIKHALRIARMVMDAATRELIVDINPLADVKLPRQVRTDDVWTWLTLDEIDQLLASKMPDKIRCALTVCVYAGLRQGELWGLRWEDVTLEGPRPELVIRRSWRGPTKTGRVGRVPLLAPAIHALKAWKKQRGDDVYVWPNRLGGVHAKGYDGGWADKKERRGGDKLLITPGRKTKAGIVRPVRFHDLRHTCASHLITGSWGRAWRMAEVSAFLRHDDTSSTQRYAHLAPDALHAAASETALNHSGHGLVTSPTGRIVDNPGKGLYFQGLGRVAQLDRASASGALGGPTESQEEALLRDQLVTRIAAARVQYLEAVAGGDPVRDRLGVRLAELTGELLSADLRTASA